MAGYMFATAETAIKAGNDHSYHRIIKPKYT